ncbi:nucleotide disphospho-sugar-binding domain-containing protein [Micromonospora sp. LOL_015]|uniref:nucleotide disphospho-sugar-binding domain-containing protein n=1 Tax=Micromonospora sp. LOL_015 TaxID=3345416 RepID=UPI003A88FD78
MKLFFMPGPAKSNVFGLGSLAVAARVNGHDVILASTAEATAAATTIGLPAMTTSGLSLTQLMTTDRAGNPLRIPTDEADLPIFVGNMFGRLAAVSLGPTRELVTRWRPDVLVSGPHAYTGPLLAAEFGLPCVRHLLTGTPADREGTHPGVEDELRPELDALGLDRIPNFDLAIDIFPASIRPVGRPVQPMRWTPTNEQRPVEPWMVTPGQRRRVLLTAGSLATPTHGIDLLRTLVAALAGLDVELIVAAPDQVGALLREEPGVTDAGWVPLDMVLPTCDLIVHHAGTMTALTALQAGVPQLIIPQDRRFVDWANMLASKDVAITLPPGGDTPDTLARAARVLLTEPLHAAAARAMADEIAAMPLPVTVLDVLKGLTA